MAHEFKKRALEGVLDGAPVALALPSIEGGAVVGDEKSEPEVSLGGQIEAALGRVHGRLARGLGSSANRASFEE